MKTLIQPIKGTRDFYPEDMAVRSWIYGKARQAAQSFGFLEYDGPFLEPIELYAAKSGEELVKEQSYVFEDRGGNLITLRPELTPSLARMVAQRQNQLNFPLRLWSFGPFWRYERPQKGRSREFFQWNVDLIGPGGPEADAELVAVVATFFRSVGLLPSQAIIRVNNRQLVDQELERMQIPASQRQPVFHLIDRREKMRPEDWEKYAGEIGLSTSQLSAIKDMLSAEDFWEKSPDLKRFFAASQAMGVGDYIRFAPDIIRGLDYYTGTVFEAQDQTGDVRRAILGGGRYDNLLADVGGEALPAVGFAMGDVVISLILENLGLIPDRGQLTAVPVLVTSFDSESMLASFTLAAELRAAGLQAATYPQEDKLSKQFKYAERIGVRVAVVLGPDEIANQQVALKDLRTRQQVSVPRADALKSIQQMLESV